MLPVLFTIPGINREVPGYGVMLMIGFLLAILWAAHRAMRSGGNPDIILNCGFIALIGGVIGGRAMFVAHYWEQFAARGDALAIAWSIVDITRGGLEFYGGFVLASLGVVAYLFLWKHSLRWYLDIVAPSAALGLAIGRVGCFLNGCCYGGVCELPWAVRFPFGSNPQSSQWEDKAPGAALREELLFSLGDSELISPVSRQSLAASPQQIDAAQVEQRAARDAHNALLAKLADMSPDARAAAQRELDRATMRLARAVSKYADVRGNMERYNLSLAQLQSLAAQHPSLPVHPTQLYSTVTAGLLAFLLSAIYWRRTRDGQVVCTMLILEPMTRWLIEVIRADNPVDTLAVFTISQGIAVGLMATGVLGLALLQSQPPRSARAVVWEPEPDAAPARAATAST